MFGLIGSADANKIGVLHHVSMKRVQETISKILILVLLMGSSHSAFSGSSDIRGGRGGSPFTIACGEGEKVGGFQIRMGKVLDGLGVACIPTNANLDGNPIIDGFAGSQGGADYRYNINRPRFLKSIQFTACDYKGRTVVRSFRASYISDNGATGWSRLYGKHCDSRHPVITHTAPRGQHIYGIIGKSGKYVDSLGVVYRPLPVTGRRTRVPLAGIIKIANDEIFDESKIVLHNLGSYGRNGGFSESASRIDIAGYVDTFSIDPYSHRRKKGVYRVEYYLNDIRSSDIYMSRGDKHPSYLKLTADFETKGRELKGFCRKKLGKKYYVCANNGDILPDVEIKSPRMILQMVPEVFNGSCGNRNINSISLVPTASDFNGKLRFAGDWKQVPNVIEKGFKRLIEDNALNGMLEEVAHKSEQELAKKLKDRKVQCLIASPIRDYIIDSIGNGSAITIRSVAIEGDDLIVAY